MTDMVEMEATRVWYELVVELEQYGSQRNNAKTQSFVEQMLRTWQEHLLRPTAQTRADLSQAVAEADAALGLLKLIRQ